MSQPRHINPAPNAPAAAPPRTGHPIRDFAIRLGLGAVVIAILLHFLNWRRVIDSIGRENPAYFAAAVILYLAGQIVFACVRWWMLTAIVKVHASFGDIVRYYFVGAFTNLFVPGLVGGDAARAIYLGRPRGRLGESFASVATDRTVGFAALFWVAALATLFLNRGEIPASVTHPTLAAGAALTALWFAAPYLARQIHRLPPKMRRYAGLVAPYIHHRGTLAIPFALSVAFQANIALCQYILARGMELPQPLSLFMLCVPLANVVAGLPITLNGLGVRDGTYVVLFGMGGMARDDALAMGLLWFAASGLAGFLGIIAFLTTPAPAAPPSHADSAASPE
ncbi:MAG: lysylphosphatidylglycerol synthase transmembrane domain-containing protein [Candidatus Binataceae bacterium]